MSNKYLDYEGLVTFKNNLDNQRTADKLETVLALNSLDESIGDGILTIKLNQSTIARFSANQATDKTVNITVPVNLSDLENSTEYIKNIILYGLPNVSELTDELKEALHELNAENSGLVSENELKNTLTNYGTKIYYDSATQYLQLKNGDTVISEFDAADFVKDNVVEDAKVVGDKLILYISTEDELKEIPIPIPDIFAASNYVTEELLADVATSGNYNDLTNKPGVITQQDINTGTNTDGKLISAKVLSDSINNALYGDGNTNGTVITTNNLNNELLAKGFAKSIQIGQETPTPADAQGILWIPKSLSETDINNIIKYGQADISGMTAEERAQAEEQNKLATLKEVESGDDDILKNILGRIWSNTNKLVSGTFNTKYKDLNNNIALIFNESDGGGIIFDKKDSRIKSFVGVNSDGENGICVQIYSKHTDSNNGSRLNANPNGIYYNVGNSASLISDNELAVKGDIPTTEEIRNIIEYGTPNAPSTLEELELAKQENGYAKISDIPSKVSDLTNDVPYISELELGSKISSAISSELSLQEGDSPISDSINNIISEYISNNNIISSSDLAEVALSGSYNDLTNRPTISEYRIVSGDDDLIGGTRGFIWNLTKDGNIVSTINIPQTFVPLSDWNQTNSNSLDYIKNKPTLFSGSWNDLTDKPTIPEGSVVDATFDKNSGNAVKNSTITTYIQDILPNEVKNIVEYGIADISEKTNEELELLKSNSDFALKSDIPTESIINNWGFTKNKGTVTGVKLENSDSTISPDNNGIITIPEGNINVQSDWDEEDSESDSYIKNKPNIITELLVLNLFDGGLDPTNNPNIITSNNLELLVTDAGFIKSEDLPILIQSNWNQTDDSAKDYILNKPTVYTQTEIENIIKYGLADISTLTEEEKELAINNSEYALKSNIPTTLPASDVYDWAKTASKPDYNLDEISDGTNRKLITNYSNLNYTGSSINSEGGQVSIDGSNNIFKITTSANISGITLTNVPENYHSCHVIIRNSSSDNDITINMSSTATVTIDNVVYSFVCPKGDITLSIAKDSNNYVEFDILRIDNELYIREI